MAVFTALHLRSSYMSGLCAVSYSFCWICVLYHQSDPFVNSGHVIASSVRLDRVNELDFYILSYRLIGSFLRSY